MKKIMLKRPCYICHGRIKSFDDNDVIKYISKTRRTIIEWYGICDYCLDRYPEIQTMFERLSALHDDEGEGNHTVMFNLIDAIKSYRWGNRYIMPYKPQK